MTQLRARAILQEFRERRPQIPVLLQRGTRSLIVTEIGGNECVGGREETVDRTVSDKREWRVRLWRTMSRYDWQLAVLQNIIAWLCDI